MTVTDKILHAFVGMLAWAMMNFVLHASPLIILPVVAAVATVKELYDRKHGKPFDVWDIVATILVPIIHTILYLWKHGNEILFLCSWA